MKASIIILTYNNLAYTRQCLESIVAVTDEPDFELILVDNASQDQTPEYLRSFASVHPNVHLVLNADNEGFARGNNQGTKIAQGEYLVFLNNDVVVTRGWLSGLIRHLQDPKVGMVGPVTNSSGNESRIRVDYQNLEEMEVFAQQYTSTHQGMSFEVGILPLFCAAIRRLVFEEVGPLDEQFGAGMFEDDDYALRLQENGYHCLCVEDVFIHHWGSAAWSIAGFSTYWQTFEKNRALFEKKWGRKWQPPRYREELIDEQIAQLVQDKTWIASLVLEREGTITHERLVIDQMRKEIAQQASLVSQLYTASDQKAQQILELASEIKLNNREIARQEEIIHLYEQKISNLETLIAQIDRLIAYKAEKLRQRDHWIKIQDREISRLKIALNDIENSTSWRIVKISWRFRFWIAPQGSKRERTLWRMLAFLERPKENEDKGGLLPRTHEVSSGEEGISPDVVDGLNQLLGQYDSDRPVIIFAPSINWKIPLFQRPQQLAMAFAKLGYLVFYCEPAESMEFEQGFHLVIPNLYVAARMPLDIFKRIQTPLLFTLVYNKKYIDHFTEPYIIYEYIDELEVFPGDQRVLQRDHEELLKSASLVLATANRLYQRIIAVRSDAILCPNGVDYEFIQSVIRSTQEPPAELRKLVEKNKPIIGYYGALATWFDYNLLLDVANSRLDYSFVLIGPDYDGSIEQSGILQKKNIYWLGPKPYTELPQYLKYFDVATIPFLLNEITHSTSPLKLFEYMSAGKPIVTTAMNESQRYPVVLVATNSQDFVTKIDHAMDLKEDQEYLQQLDLLARENTWAKRTKMILSAYYKSQKRSVKTG